MRPVDSSTDGAHICLLQISAPAFSTFIFELKYIVILKLWETLQTVEQKPKPPLKWYSALPQTLHDFLVDPRVNFVTCDGRNDMPVVERLCGIRSQEDQPSGNRKIGFIDLQSWAVAKGLTWTGCPAPNTGHTQKHPLCLMLMVAYGMMGGVAETPKMAPMFDAKRRKMEFDSPAEAAKTFLQKLSPVEEEYTIMDPAYTLYVAYTFLMTSTRDSTPPILRHIRDDL
ncbi:MAG: hypothetical protein GY696_35655, partial [Gammaproteobacteria bacterium]|nr:hypothetical protein [Gammaproteobacteria bacterium]